VDKSEGVKVAEDVNAKFIAELEKRKSGLSKLALRISQALDATSVKQFQFQGEVIEAPPLIDHKTRLEAVKMVIDVFGVNAATKHELFGKDGLPIEFNVLVDND
jgi:hypothetical protein